MGEVNEFCFFYAGESWTSPFSLGLSFPIRALDWMAVIVPPISGWVKVVSLGGSERLGVSVCVRPLWVVSLWGPVWAAVCMSALGVQLPFVGPVGVGMPAHVL